MSCWRLLYETTSSLGRIVEIRISAAVLVIDENVGIWPAKEVIPIMVTFAAVGNIHIISI